LRGRLDDHRLVGGFGLRLVLVPEVVPEGEQFFAATALCGGEGRHGEARVPWVCIFHNTTLVRFR